MATQKIREIPLSSLQPAVFIREQVAAIAGEVGDGTAVNALSGGVDSSVVILLGHRALGDRLKTFFIENGIMREGEAKRIAVVRAAMAIGEEELAGSGAFQYLAILHHDRVTGVVSVTYNVTRKPPSTIEAVQGDRGSSTAQDRPGNGGQAAPPALSP